MSARKDLVILQGKTFSLVLRWEAPPIVYKPITAITQSAPVRIEAEGHGLPDGWRAAAVSVKGMTEINSEVSDSGSVLDYHPATVIDADNVEFNDINAAGFKAYVSGGYLQYNTPVDLTGMTARMDIKDKVGGAVLLELASGSGIAIDNTSKTITLTISAADTALLDWRAGVYELELASGDAEPVVTTLLTGKITVTREITT